MRLLCLRHGQSEYNILGLCNDDPGRPVPLTARGRAQAGAAAAALAGEPLERVFCSELPRARETAAIIARPHQLAVQPHPALNDIRTGCDGRPVAEYFRALGGNRLTDRVGSGETLLDHQARVLGFLDWLQPQPLTTVLVVAHEETLRVFAVWQRQLPPPALEGLAFGNCEVLELRL
jgi:alpha-ribazole phosphatase